MAKRLALHPACKLFPGLNESELQELADDIKANGLQNSIVLLDGKILDGRNRYAACKLAGVEPHFIDWDSDGSPVEWVISQNLIRRHLTASQRAVVALDLLPMLEKEAKQRQRRSNGRGIKVANTLPFRQMGRPAKWLHGSPSQMLGTWRLSNPSMESHPNWCNASESAR